MNTTNTREITFFDANIHDTTTSSSPLGKRKTAGHTSDIPESESKLTRCSVLPPSRSTENLPTITAQPMKHARGNKLLTNNSPIALVQKGPFGNTLLHELAYPEEGQTSYQLAKRLCYDEARSIKQMDNLLRGLSDSTHTQADFINTKNNQGETPLDCAIDAGRDKVAQWLLDNGAHLRAEGDGTPSIIRAVETGELEMVKTIITSVTNKADLNTIRGTTGDLAIHTACDNLNLDIIAFLLSQGADANTRNSENLTPLQVLAINANATSDADESSGENHDIIQAVELLLEAGANSDLQQFDELEVDSAKIQHCIRLAQSNIEDAKLLTSLDPGS